jgi:hypothetical protein
MESEGLFQKPKKRIYVGYDHQSDGPAFDRFQRMFASLYDIVRDNSLERELGTENGDAYVRSLREGSLGESACAMILCGARTHLDPFVDWEIKAALDCGIGLAGIILPPNPPSPADPEQPLLPDRMQANFDGGYAVICRWHELVSSKVDLGARINFAMDRDRVLIRNDLPLRAARFA